MDIHPSSPSISIDSYLRQIQIALGQKLALKKSIYLDLNFWILLRDASQNDGGSHGHELLKLLRKGVSTGHLCCPISETVFIELLKQTDPKTLSATAALIDELSLGATLIPQEDRIQIEISHFIHTLSNSPDLNPLDHLVWTKLCYILDSYHLSLPNSNPETELTLQKEFLDYAWNIPLLKMVGKIGNDAFSEHGQDDLTEQLNSGIARHADELRSFEQAYSTEVRGLVDLSGDMLPEIIVTVARNEGIILNDPTAKKRRDSINRYKNLLAIALEKNKGRDSLRTTHILASLHASLRWNKGQKFKRNDLADFEHASAGLAYCDAFFTDGPLCNMITQNHLKLDKLFDCFVTAKQNDAIDWLHNFLN